MDQNASDLYMTDILDSSLLDSVCDEQYEEIRYPETLPTQDRQILEDENEVRITAFTDPFLVVLL